MKKFLSLVLALVMTMSLVTISAGAEDFTDDASINYEEAVDVMSAIGVVGGYADGSFNPTAGLSRGAAAKIICNMILGPTTAAALSADTAPYKDVAIDNTYAGYVAYCAQQGIISGYADGTFRPYASLTGYAFMKMLLGALGYDAAVEGYTGANWSINVAKRALNIGLDDGLVDAFVGTKALTREEACLYAFNALQADMVEYDTTITIGDITVAGSRAAVVENDGKTDGNIARDGEMQFAEKYFTNLKGQADTDAFERPATTWKIKSKTVGTYAETADLSYTAAVKVGTIYSDLGLTKGIADEDTVVYMDGAVVTGAGSWTTYDIVRGDITNKIGGNGALTEVYYDADTNSARIVVVNTYVAKVAAARPETTTLDAYVVLGTAAPFTTPVGVSTVGNYETDEFAKDDIVRYTYSKKADVNAIQSMDLAEKVTGAMTGYTTTGSVTVGEKISGNTISAANIAAFAATVDKGDDVVVYLDEYGYGLYIDADVAAQYAVVVNYVDNAGDFNDTEKAELLFTDGTTKTVEVETDLDGDGVANDEVSSTFATAADSKITKYDIVSYVVDSDDIYTLTLVADADAGKAGGAFSLTNGIHTFSIASGNEANVAGAKNTIYADGETIFLVADTSGSKPVYSVYEGFAAVPTIKHNGGAAGAVAVFMDSTSNGDPATVVFVEKNARMTMTTDNKDVIYVKGSSTVRDSYTTALGTYYEYDAFVNGEETTIKATTRITEATLVYGPSYNAKGLLVLANCEDYVNASVPGTDMAYAVGTNSVINEVIKLGTASYAYTDDVNVYYINVDGKLVPSDITAVAEDTNDKVFLKVNDKGLLTDVYVQIVDVPTAIGPADSSIVGAIAGSDRGTGTMGVNVQRTGTSSVSETVHVGLWVMNGGTFVFMRDVAVTVAAGTNNWGTAVTISGLSAGQYQLTCGDMAPVFVRMA